MFSYKLTIKNRKSRKAKLEKFYDALESSDLTKAEKTHMRKQISSTVRSFYALAKKFNCLPMTIKRTYENAKISIRIKLMHAGTLDALGDHLIRLFDMKYYTPVQLTVTFPNPAGDDLSAAIELTNAVKQKT